MTVRLGDRKLSKIEVLYQALRLNEAVVELSLRSFGIRSRNSPLRSKYARLLNQNDDPNRIDNMILAKRDKIEQYADSIVDKLNAANAIYPKSKMEYELRLNYQDEALATCEMLSKELNSVAKFLDVDVNCFKTVIPLLDYEKHLIREWRKSDRKRFSGYLL